MFLKPGQLSKASFGISFEADKDGGPEEQFISNPATSLRDHRHSLPVARYRYNLMTLVNSLAANGNTQSQLVNAWCAAESNLS